MRLMCGLMGLNLGALLIFELCKGLITFLYNSKWIAQLWTLSRAGFSKKSSLKTHISDLGNDIQRSTYVSQDSTVGIELSL